MQPLPSRPVRVPAPAAVARAPVRPAPRAADATAPPALALAAAALVALTSPAAALARGLESVDLPSLPAPAVDGAAPQRATLAAADDAFEASPLLKELRERSAANRAKNRKAIENKYCYRQAELGIGDCGGLKLIPGATAGGKQKTPGWLGKLLGADPDKLAAVQDSPEAAAAAAAMRGLLEAPTE